MELSYKFTVVKKEENKYLYSIFKNDWCISTKYYDKNPLEEIDIKYITSTIRKNAEEYIGCDLPDCFECDIGFWMSIKKNPDTKECVGKIIFDTNDYITE